MSRLAAFVGSALIVLAVLVGAFAGGSSNAAARSTADSTPAAAATPNCACWGP
ncbi:hypothetical protein ABH931_007683 [Streptacidiphilus sp. MAP12-33]|jgi:hypothetical protein|uniref:hypothetical protein n=1 Tax=Streptacidiphilus sp. MAP12-33 TaxID=3156266 RepID=UPI003510FF3C